MCRSDIGLDGWVDCLAGRQVGDRDGRAGGFWGDRVTR